MISTPFKIALAAAALAAFAGYADAKPLTAKQILEKSAKHYDLVNDYTVDTKMSVESPMMNVPETPVTIYYKKPDKVTVKSNDRFTVLPKQGLVVGNPVRQAMVGAEPSLGKSEQALGVSCYVVHTTAKHDGRSVQSTLWIDKKDFLLRQIVANPEWGSSVKAKIWYTKVKSRYWLPLSTVAQVSIPPIPGMESKAGGKSGEPTIVKMKFSNYRINTGLSDKIFEKQQGDK